MTGPVCPWRGFCILAPVSASHGHIVSSIEPDAILLPSGENATDQTGPVCPWRGLPTWTPVSASQRQIASSFEPDAILLPSGENATDITCPLCPLHTCCMLGQS